MTAINDISLAFRKEPSFLRLRLRLRARNLFTVSVSFTALARKNDSWPNIKIEIDP